MTTVDKNLKTAIDILKSEFNPTRLFLFGSQANGTATEESDYDFLMVVKNWSPDLQLEHMNRARQLLAKQGIDADIFVYGEIDFEERRQEFSTIPEVATTTGYEIELNE